MSAGKWFIVLTKPRQEQKAAENLINQGGSIYLPYFNTERIISGKRIISEEILFPGYLFLNTTADNALLHKVKYTLGGRRLLAIAGKPMTIDQSLINDIKIRSQLLVPAPSYTAGDQLEITDGPFKSYQAIFKNYKGQDRALVLINLLGQQNELLVQLAQFKKSNSPY